MDVFKTLKLSYVPLDTIFHPIWQNDFVPFIVTNFALYHLIIIRYY